MSKKNIAQNAQNVNKITVSDIEIRVSYDIRYPEIAREKKNNRISMDTAKVFLYDNGYITKEDLLNPDCNYTTITRGIYQAFCDGKLTLNATKQDGTYNYTVVRVSTGLSGKLDTLLAVTTVSLVNQFCLKRMTIEDLVCSKCYVPESLRIDGILAFAQNMFVLTHIDLSEFPQFIPQLRTEWAKNRIMKDLNTAKRDGKIDISDDEIAHIANLKPLCRFESMGDLACTLQAKNYLITARENPDFDFALWTKNPAVLSFAIDTMGKPSNLATVFSMSRKNVMDNDNIINRYRGYFDHMFIVVDNDDIRDGYLAKDNFYSCHCEHYSCIRCRRCYKRTNEIDTAVERLRDKKLK